MKKVLSTLALAATLATSASAYSYSTPGVSTGGALTEWDLQPAFSLEGLYGIAADSDDPDMSGVRLGFSLTSDAVEDVRHQFGIYVAPMWGSETYTVGNVDFDVDTQLIPVTLGYDINIALNDYILLDLGVKAGYSFGKADVSVTGLGSDDISAKGFTYSIGAGLKFMVSDTINIKLGYEFGRTYLKGDYYGVDVDTIYGAHVISLGVGCRF